jgi:thioester reductase-like protein/short-subunit dehydrogenase involved in D-alanine esterification of teichoic acids
MAYLVTGATGFIGRHVVEEILRRRDAEVFVLVRAASLARLHRLADRWSDPNRVIPVTGDLTESRLGVDESWVEEHRGRIEHMVHLAALYDMTASDERNEQLNVGGTRAAVDLAESLQAGCFHHVSSVAVAGDHEGVFDETMFDVGQRLPSPYHRTKYESERIVREECSVPWRVYRPSVVVGHSHTGEIDKIDGPYYFFPTLKRLRDALPQWTPLVGVDLGDTNIVPVDYVARALDHLAHQPGLDHQTFHLVNPDPQSTIEVVNTLAAAAQAPRFALPVDRHVADALPAPMRRLPRRLLGAAFRTGAGRLVLQQTLGRLGIPPEVMAHTGFPSTFASRHTEQALASSAVACPPLESYASVLWDYWEQNLDPWTARDTRARRALRGRKVVITGASSGIGRATALKIAQAGGVPLMVARSKDDLEDLRSHIAATGGEAMVYPCDLSDLEAIDRLSEQITTDHGSIDFIVNNAGRSIRRSLRLSHDRFHDFERTMQLNYFGAIRLVIGLLDALGREGRGHVVNVSSIGVQTHPPRFSAYVASKSALDAWSRVVASELVGDGVTFTTVHMPLVRTPMIEPTRIYDSFPTITPAQAADMVIRAMKVRPHEVNTRLGTLGELGHALAPKAMFRVLHLGYRVFPDDARRDVGEGDDGSTTQEQLLLARVLRGIHW